MPVAPKWMRENAKKGLEYRKEAKTKGGFSTQEAAEHGVGSGVQRAVNIKNGDNLSLETLKDIRNFFNRFRSKISKMKRNKEERMYQSFLLWGGDNNGRTAGDWAESELEKHSRKFAENQNFDYSCPHCGSTSFCEHKEGFLYD